MCPIAFLFQKLLFQTKKIIAKFVQKLIAIFQGTIIKFLVTKIGYRSLYLIQGSIKGRQANFQQIVGALNNYVEYN